MTRPEDIPPRPDFGFTPGPLTLGVAEEDDASWYEVRGAADVEGWQTVLAEVYTLADAQLFAASPALFRAACMALEQLLTDHYGTALGAKIMDELYANRFAAWPDDVTSTMHPAEALRRALAEAVQQ